MAALETEKAQLVSELEAKPEATPVALASSSWVTLRSTTRRLPSHRP